MSPAPDQVRTSQEMERIREGYVSLGRACEEQGVAVDSVTWTVLADETAKRAHTGQLTPR